MKICNAVRQHSNIEIEPNPSRQRWVLKMKTFHLLSIQNQRSVNMTAVFWWKCKLVVLLTSAYVWSNPCKSGSRFPKVVWSKVHIPLPTKMVDIKYDFSRDLWTVPFKKTSIDKKLRSLYFTRFPFSSFPRQNAGAKINGTITVAPKHVKKCCAPNKMHIYHGGTENNSPKVTRFERGELVVSNYYSNWPIFWAIFENYADSLTIFGSVK